MSSEKKCNMIKVSSHHEKMLFNIMIDRERTATFQNNNTNQASLPVLLVKYTDNVCRYVHTLHIPIAIKLEKMKREKRVRQRLFM